MNKTDSSDTLNTSIHNHGGHDHEIVYKCDCGQKYKTKSKYLNRVQLSKNFISHFNQKYTGSWTSYTNEKEVTLWTSYLGPVKVPIWDSPVEDCVFLQTINSDGVLIKVLNIYEVMGIFGAAGLPDIEFLKKINPASVNIKENEENYHKIQKFLKYKREEPFKSDPDLISLANDALKELYAKNICVDIFFNSIMYLKFIKEKFGRSNINNTKHLISIYNIPDLDNAFFTGEFMVYGNGSSLFYPLGSPDVASHELTHGLTQTLCNLKYEGESGALNESFSDIFATAFDFWLHDNFKNIPGKPGWYIGMTIGYNVLYLRNMKDPSEGPCKQPSEYHGKYWEFSDEDNGGVHTNSGPSNRCFYLISMDIGIENAIQLYYKCLSNMPEDGEYSDYGRILIHLSTDNKTLDAVMEALKKINLVP